MEGGANSPYVQQRSLVKSLLFRIHLHVSNMHELPYDSGPLEPFSKHKGMRIPCEANAHTNAHKHLHT